MASRFLPLVLLMGCTGLIEEDVPDGVSPEQEAARKAWVVDAQPTLDQNCASCHGGSRPEVAWLEGSPDIQAQRMDLLTYPKMIVNMGAPQLSELIKHGAHEGPALSAQQASKLLNWIMKERDAGGMGNLFPIMTPPVAITPCTGGVAGSATCPFIEVPLDAAGAAGAKVQFTAMDVSGELYLSGLKFIPGPGGVRIEHPMFVSVPAAPAAPKLDPIDRYGTLTLNLAANAPVAMQTLGTGTASFSGFLIADPVSIYFKAVGPAM